MQITGNVSTEHYPLYWTHDKGYRSIELVLSKHKALSRCAYEHQKYVRMKIPSTLQRKSNSIIGCVSQIKIHDWSKARRIFANKFCIGLEVAVCDCETCNERRKFVAERLKSKKIPHFFDRRWVIIANYWVPSDPVKYLKEILGVEIEEISRS